jgi:hypothetical protein
MSNVPCPYCNSGCDECVDGAMWCVNCDKRPAVDLLGFDPVCGPCRDKRACEVCGEDHETGEHADIAYDNRVASMEGRMGV